jgi:hypothetical protein
MSVKSDNERRIRNGRRAFKAYCDQRNLPAVERREEYTATDLITDVLHFARHKGWDIETILRQSQDHAEQEAVEKCAFCGTLVTHEWAETDDTPDGVPTAYYCSPSCKSLSQTKKEENAKA